MRGGGEGIVAFRGERGSYNFIAGLKPRDEVEPPSAACL